MTIKNLKPLNDRFVLVWVLVPLAGSFILAAEESYTRMGQIFSTFRFLTVVSRLDRLMNLTVQNTTIATDPHFDIVARL